MATKQYEISELTCLRLAHCRGPVAVQGWARPEVEVQVPDILQNLTDEQTATALTISVQGPCTVRCPNNTSIEIGRVEGPLSVAELSRNLSVDDCQGPVLLRALRSGASLNQVTGSLQARSIGGHLEIDTIAGNTSLKSVDGSVQIGRVGGALTVRRMSGDLSVHSTGGNMRAWKLDGTLRIGLLGGSLTAYGIVGGVEGETINGRARLHDVGGATSVQTVGGDLQASALNGGMSVGVVAGDLRLDGPLSPGQCYRADTAGSATLRLPVSTSARLDLSAQGRVHSDIPLSSTELDEARHLVGLLGDGAATVVITAAGSIRITTLSDREGTAGGWPQDLEEIAQEVDRHVVDALRDVDFTSVGEQIDRQVNEALRSIDFGAFAECATSGVQWAEQKLDAVDWERLGREARKAAEAGISHAQQAIERALARMEAGDLDPAVPSQATMPEPQPEAAAPTRNEPIGEERMAILRMVESGQVTPEEAEMLLDALDE